MENLNFNHKCWKIITKIPMGRVTTYKEIAKALNSKGYRAVGNAMNKNPHAPKVPCHRVVCSNGKLGGYALGINKKRALLVKEGVKFKNGKVTNLNKVIFTAKNLKKK